MEIFSRLSVVMLTSLAVTALLSGCGGGGGSSISPTPTATPTPGGFPSTPATFNLSVTKSANGNYIGPNFKTSGSFQNGPFPNSFLLSCGVPQAGSTSQNFKGGAVSITLFGALEQGKVFLVNPPTSDPFAPSVAATVSYDDGVSTKSELWDDNELSNSGQITVQSLSSTTVKLKVENVLLPARPDTTATGTVTLNGTIKATLLQ